MQKIGQLRDMDHYHHSGNNYHHADQKNSKDGHLWRSVFYIENDHEWRVTANGDMSSRTPWLCDTPIAGTAQAIKILGKFHKHFLIFVNIFLKNRVSPTVFNSVYIQCWNRITLENIFPFQAATWCFTTVSVKLHVLLNINKAIVIFFSIYIFRIKFLQNTKFSTIYL